MSFEETLETVLRRVVREELRAAGGTLAAAEPEPDLVKLGEVKRWVQVSRTWLKERIKAGELEAFGRGRLLRVRLVDVRALLKRRASPSEAIAPSVRAGQILASLHRRAG